MPSSKILAWAALSGSIVSASTCDIYANHNTPCVAAHSTTRALYSAYNGPLYQVKRSSDSTTTDIKPLGAGGVANATAQDSFCAGTSCLITVIYDQSPQGNHLTQAPPGSAAHGPQPGGYDNLANANDAPVQLNGHKVYGVFIAPATGYRNDKTTGIAMGDDPEGLYAVLAGDHYNSGCCFDYGNAERDNTDPQNGAMEAIYFGNRHVIGGGQGNGPWIEADLENGLYSTGSKASNPNLPSIDFRFVTAVLKGKHNHWSLRGGNAASGPLSTYYDGVRPSGGYSPMVKKGAIVLGVGGDNSDQGQGTFYEGVMTTGYPTDAAEDAVQANIVSAKYTTM